ncbi:MAG: hypothetical protein E7033_02780 [Akkermansiaceae bacterium]|nr:hypothetical protein [Akkermansiaceae bacterium]
MARKKQVSAIPRAVIFLILAAFFFAMAARLQASWHKTLLYGFAVLDAVWGVALLAIARKKPRF